MKMIHPAHPDAKNHTFTGVLMRAGCVFDPGTIATIATISQYASIASTALSVVGAVSGAADSRAAYKSQAAADRANAQILRDNAAQASREASAKEDQLRARQRVIRGNQVASIAESGIGFEGTGGDLVEQSDINATLENLTVRYEGETAARSLNYQAEQSTYDAAVANNAAGNAMTSGYFSAVGEAAKGAASYASWQSKYGTKNKKL